MIKEIEGNIVTLAKEDKFDVLINATNCFHINNTVIAVQIAKEFSKAYKADLETTKGWVRKLGDYSYFYYKNRKLKIVNIYTQYNSDSCHEYTAIALSLRMLVGSLDGNEYIGISGEFGNLDKKLVKSIIDGELADFDVTIVNLPKQKIILKDNPKLDYDVHIFQLEKEFKPYLKKKDKEKEELIQEFKINKLFQYDI